MNDDIQRQNEDILMSSDEVKSKEITFDVKEAEQVINEEVLKCKSCGSPEIEEGYSLALCSECRDKLSKHPIPIQIKIAAIVFVLVIIVSVFKFPSAIKVGIEYER